MPSVAASSSAPSPNREARTAAALLTPPERLDELLALTPATLATLYAQARVPRLPDLTGDLRGRMLAWEGLGGVPALLLRTLASARNFPWRGKSFAHASEQGGQGDNRVVVERFHLFKFDTFVGPSRAGRFDAVQLDYDKPSNPFFIRAIKDEVRELRAGLWLGQAYLVLPRAQPRLVLHFGLEKRLPS